MKEYRVSVYGKGGAAVSHSEWMGELESDALTTALQKKHGEAAVELAWRIPMVGGTTTYGVVVHAANRFE